MKYARYILIVRDNVQRDNEIMHVSGHETRAGAESKAEAISAKAPYDLKAEIYVAGRQHADPSTWQHIANIAL